MVQPWLVDGTPTRNHSESLFPLASNFSFRKVYVPVNFVAGSSIPTFRVSANLSAAVVVFTMF